MGNRYLYITLLSVLAIQAEAQGQEELRPVPKLVVNITIDQLRSDKLELMMPSYGEDGFRKLWREGCVYEQAQYPFSPDRASATATLVTGTTPFYHTITGERWVSRETLRPFHCTESPKTGKPSAEHIAVSTIGDELKMATAGQGRVMAVAKTADAAILSAGHTPDGVFWNDNPRKPWSHRDITDQALRCVTEGGLGQDTIPDLLFLAYDASGQNQQTYKHLDEELARLLNNIETQVGAGQTLYVITSTGYEEIDRTDYERYHVPTGTFYINRSANLLNMYLGALWGTGRYVDAYDRNHIYLSHKLLENKRISLDEALQKGREFLLQMTGVKQVESHPYELHSGDLVIKTAPGWQIENEDTHEQLPLKQQLACFPIIIYGTGIQAASIQTPVTADRIAPAIAKAIRIRAPNGCSATPLF